MILLKFLLTRIEWILGQVTAEMQQVVEESSKKKTDPANDCHAATNDGLHLRGVATHMDSHLCFCLTHHCTLYTMYTIYTVHYKSTKHLLIL